MPAHKYWYELIESPSSVLRQGDLVLGTPMLVVSEDADQEHKTSGTTSAESVEGSWILVTNSCDLQHISSPKRCPYVLIAAVSALDSVMDLTKDRDRQVAELFRRGSVQNGFLLPEAPTPLAMPLSLVNFRETISVPAPHIARWAEDAAPRLRLRSPFRERFGAAFAAHIGSVGIEDEMQISPFVKSFYPKQRLRAEDAIEADE